jgi:hypothetical protein
MMNPTTEVPITLQIAEWNAVLEQLMNGPYRIVAPLLEKIGAQARAAEGPRWTAQPNGVDSHAPD